MKEKAWFFSVIRQVVSSFRLTGRLCPDCMWRGGMSSAWRCLWGTRVRGPLPPPQASIRRASPLVTSSKSPLGRWSTFSGELAFGFTFGGKRTIPCCSLRARPLHRLCPLLLLRDHPLQLSAIWEQVSSPLRPPLCVLGCGVFQPFVSLDKRFSNYGHRVHTPFHCCRSSMSVLGDLGHSFLCSLGHPGLEASAPDVLKNS